MDTNRREFCAKMAGAASALGFPDIVRGRSRGAGRPNIVFVLADDQRFDALSAMGNRTIQTPHHDQLAAGGLLFTNHYDTSPICMASRPTIMNGQYEFRHGCNFTIGSMSRASFARTYPALVRKAGYRTGFGGKFGFAVTPEARTTVEEAEANLPSDQFDSWAGWPKQGFHQTAKNDRLKAYAERYPGTSRALGAWACDFIKEFAARQPFCLSISFKAPHDPEEPDPLDFSLYQGVSFPKPANWGEAGAQHLPPQAKASRMYLTEEGRRWTTDYDRHLRLYYQLINGNDVALGMIREQLARQGVDGNTVIIFTSDNGYACGAHALGGKVFPYEDSARAPLIIYDPRQPALAGKKCAALTANLDMAPTVLDFAGVPAPGGMDGTSLLPLLRDPGRRIRTSLGLVNAWPWSRESLCLSVVTPDWKYIYWFYGDSRMEPAEELYDMRRDRLEMFNLAGKAEHARTLAAMRSLYDRFRLRALESASRDIPHYRRYLEWADRHTPWTQKTWLEHTLQERDEREAQMHRQTRQD